MALPSVAALFLVTVLAFTQVRCKEFNVYWNLPTVVCKVFNVSFKDAGKEYGIIQNKNDEFRGDKVVIFYNPGLFPLVKNYTHNYTAKVQNLDYIVLVNGGIPQDADITIHFEAFQKQIETEIPDPLFDGLAIIDMEQWGATWAQNFGNQEVHRILSRMKVQKKYPTWTTAEVEQKAKYDYERAAYRLMYTTLVFAQALRPNGKWGYYIYPQCYNTPGVGVCSKGAQAENNQLVLLFKRSGALFPSAYIGYTGNVTDNALMVKGRVNEATRVQQLVGANSLNLPYIKLVYYFRTDYLREEDLDALLRVPKEEGADGVVVWGSWNDVNSKEKCLRFKDYLATTFGPLARQYISSDNSVDIPTDRITNL